MSQKNLIIVIICLFILLNIFSLKTYLPTMVDETVTASRTKAYIESGFAYGQLDRGVLDQIPKVESTINTLPYLLYSISNLTNEKISLWNLRFTNLLAGFFLLIAIYFIARKIIDEKYAIFCVLITSLSAIFIFATHLARPDIFAATIGFCTLAASLYVQSHFSLFLLGLLLSLSISIHARIIIFFPIIFMLILQTLNWKVLKSINKLGLFTLGGIIGITIYYFLHIYPNKDAFILMNKIIIGSSKTPPILDLNYNNFLISLNGFFHSLRIDWIYWIIIPEIILLLFTRKKSDLIILNLLITTTVTAFLLINFIYYYNIILIYPVYLFALTHFLYRIFFYYNFKMFNIKINQIVIIILVCLLSFKNFNRAFTSGIKCNNDYKENIELIKNYIQPNDIILGAPNFWIDLENKHYYSWENLKYYLTLHPNSSIKDAFKWLNPKFLILNSGVTFYISDQKSSNPDIESLRINASEFKQFLDQHAELILNKVEACDGPLQIYRINSI